MVPTSEPTVFIIDDDQDIRSSLSRALTKRGYAVEAFPSAKVFLDAFTSDYSGCLILDYGMPDMNGLELQEVLVERGIALPVIFITGHGGVPESVKAIKQGAIDFIEKPFRTDMLIERINAAFDILAEASSTNLKAAEARAKLAVLTAREREIVDFIVSNPSNTTSKDIARALNISPRTVDHHRARILEKMQLKSILELVNISNLADVGSP